MEEYSGNEKPCPTLLELMPSRRDWCGKGDRISRDHCSSSEEKNLELRLGPPGEEKSGGTKFHLLSSANQVPSKSSQKRVAPAQVVGWPPVRSFRKNLTSAKPIPQPQERVQSGPSGEKSIEGNDRSLFVKINMEGVPIGRKVNLNLYNNYEKLGAAVDELFRGLLAARKDSSDGGIMNMENEEKTISDVLDGTGEYTLVYEDKEGDRVLVADVPWQMFLSNVKRLLVLKSADLFAPKRQDDGFGGRIGGFH